MADLSRSQLLVYGAVAVTLLLVGARWIRSADGATPGGGVSYASSSGEGSGSGNSFSVFGQGGEDVVVDVSGAVRSSGVYRLPAGSRVIDALERAGGESGDADLDAINLAARLVDGQQVVVPERVAASSATSAAAAMAGASPEVPISLGTATVADLDTIEGIGPVTAQEIVEFRDQHGGVSSIDQLDEIDGIGPATLDALRAGLQP